MTFCFCKESFLMNYSKWHFFSTRTWCESPAASPARTPRSLNSFMVCLQSISQRIRSLIENPRTRCSFYGVLGMVCFDWHLCFIWVFMECLSLFKPPFFPHMFARIHVCPCCWMKASPGVGKDIVWSSCFLCLRSMFLFLCRCHTLQLGAE
mgnify:CR=1 FL=1